MNNAFLRAEKSGVQVCIAWAWHICVWRQGRFRPHSLRIVCRLSHLSLNHERGRQSNVSSCQWRLDLLPFDNSNTKERCSSSQALLSTPRSSSCAIKPPSPHLIHTILTHCTCMHSSRRQRTSRRISPRDFAPPQRYGDFLTSSSRPSTHQCSAAGKRAGQERPSRGYLQSAAADQALRAYSRPAR
jgi:hypothetical protein